MIKIDDTELNVGAFNITRQIILNDKYKEKTLSGKIVREIKNKTIIYAMTFSNIDDVDYNKMIEILSNNSAEHTITFPYAINSYKTLHIVVSAISDRMIVKNNQGVYWSEATITYEVQPE